MGGNMNKELTLEEILSNKPVTPLCNFGLKGKCLSWTEETGWQVQDVPLEIEENE